MFFRTNQSLESYKIWDRVESALCTLFLKFLLLPAVGVIDGCRPNVELSGQCFYQCLCPFYLKVGWAENFATDYNTDADCLFAATPGLTVGN